MRLLHVCAELFPLLKTGGLADVLGALPQAQKKKGAEVRVLLPGFPAFFAGIGETMLVTHLHTFAGPVALRYGHYHGLEIYLIDAPHLYNRPGNPYHDEHHQAYGDNHLRFALLGWIAAEMACGLDPYWRPEIVHAHDWHAGLTPAYLALRGHPARSVFTVHNLAYAGLFAPHHLEEISLPPHMMQMHGVEFYGQISFLKAGLFYADHVTTVSPTYAREITHPEYSHGLDGLLRERQHQGRLSGILNGVDDQIWSPAKDDSLAKTYDLKHLADKQRNKTALQQELGLEVNAKKPLFIIVSRLTEQKGLDLVLEVLPTLAHYDGQLAVLGNGDPYLEECFLKAAENYPKSVAVRITYNEKLSHRMIGGGDVIIIPSRFEPCGLTQLYGLKYGTLPLVRRTGGLADTVTDCTLENLMEKSATGFVFQESNVKALDSAVRRAFALWRQPEAWQQVQQAAMQQNFGWEVAADAYLSLYQHLL